MGHNCQSGKNKPQCLPLFSGTLGLLSRFKALSDFELSKIVPGAENKIIGNQKVFIGSYGTTQIHTYFFPHIWPLVWTDQFCCT